MGGGQDRSEGEFLGCGIDLVAEAEAYGRGHGFQGRGRARGHGVRGPFRGPPVSCEEKIASAREASRMLATLALFTELGRDKLRP